MYNEIVSKFLDTFEKGKTYIITNGKIKKVDPKYENMSVNKVIELTLTQYTIVDKADDLYYDKLLSYRFSPLEEFKSYEKQNKSIGKISIKLLFIISFFFYINDN